jgi:hypothetical protein
MGYTYSYAVVGPELVAEATPVLVEDHHGQVEAEATLCPPLLEDDGILLS